MPSFLVGNPLLSGPQIITSGWPYSGSKANYPIGYVQIRVHPNASGNVYIGYSGGMTLNSGGMFLSGGGINDGMLLGPGDAFAVPRIATGQSGNLSIYFRHDEAASGQARIYYELYSWVAPIGAALALLAGQVMNCI